MNQKKIRINSKKKGNSLEENLKKLMTLALKEWGFEPIEIRIQKSGSQFGKDSITRWVEVKGKIHIGFDWCIEAKNYGDLTKSGIIVPEKIRSKRDQIYNSQVPLHCWCIISPFGDVDNGFREDVDTNRYPFKTVLWTRDHQIERLIACFPEVYKDIYKIDPTITTEERKRILSVWKQQIIKATKEGKKLREGFTTNSSSTIKTPGDKTPEMAQELGKKTVEREIYTSGTKPLSTTSKSVSEGVQRVAIHEEMDKAKELLDKGRVSEAKVEYFKILGKIEDKSGYEIELAKINNNLGVIFHIEGDLDKAADYFKKAIGFDKDFTIAAKNLASLYIARSTLLKEEDSKRELGKAETILKPLLETPKNPNPDVIQVMLKLIKVREGLQGVNKFIQENEKKYNQLFTKNDNIVLTLGQIYLEFHNLDKALEYANLSVELNSDPDSLLLRGRVLLAIALEKDAKPYTQSYGDITPEFNETATLKKAKADFDKAFSIAQEQDLVMYYNEALYLMNVVRSWLKEAPLDISLPREAELYFKESFGDKFIEVSQAFRRKEYETSYTLLKSLPEFEKMGYEELRRIARAYLYNGQPEIAKHIFSKIEEEAIKKKDVTHYLDMSMVYALLGDKNNTFIAAGKAKDMAEGEYRKVVFSHYGAVMLRYANEEGGDRLLENALQFEKEFPEIPILERIDFEKEKDKVIKIVQDRQKWAQEIKDKFRKNPIPSYFLQKTFNKPFISVWKGRDPEMPIEFTSPEPSFIQELEENFAASDTLVFDYLSLLTLARLNLLNDLEKLKHKLQVSFNLFQKIQEELLQEEDVNLRKVWEFLRKSSGIELIKDIPKIDLKEDRLSEIFEEWFIDTLKLGKRPKTVVVTDDLRIIKFLRSQEVKSINSWLILQKIRDLGLLDPKMYSKALGKLAECFYTFISFNGEDLFEIAAEDNFKLTARSYFLIDQVNLPGSDLKSFSIVFGRFMKEVWRPGLLIEDKIRWLDHISNVIGTLAETLPPSIPPSSIDERMRQVLDTAEDFANIWVIAINLSNKDDLLELKAKFPEMIKQPVFAKVKEQIRGIIEKRLEKLGNK